MAKTKFSKFFIKKFIRVFLFVMIIYAIITGAVIIMFKLMNESFVTNESLNISSAIRDAENKNEYLRNNAYEFFSCTCSDDFANSQVGKEQYVAVTVDDRVITFGEFSCLVLFRENEDEKKTAFYKITNEEIVAQIKDYYVKGYDIEISGLYYNKNDGSCIPQTLNFFEVDRKTYKRSDFCYKTVDYAPENAENYIYTNNNAKIISNGATENNETFKALKQWVNTATDSPDISKIKGDVYTDMRTFETDNGLLKVYFLSSYDVISQIGRAIIYYLIVCIIISVVIAFVWSKILYTGYSAKYDFDSYRVNLTNALAHDLKTPLTAVLGYAENISSKTNPEKNDYYVTSIINSATYMNDIIESTLEFSKAESIKSVVCESVDIRECFKEQSDILWADFLKNNIELKVSGDGKISADKRMLSRAVYNILLNCLKFSDKESEVEIKISDKEFSVSNKYSYDIKKSASELCMPYVKGDDSRTGSKGSGLGLSIVKSICDVHGFKLDITLKDSVFSVTVQEK
ncbi:MAG: HAMP domain-containing histidine kinase [Oscillospiraceae bacterium]|nr:HAMP domain-containing histidine kinase [Oscillospiraceae bacterium]